MYTLLESTFSFFVCLCFVFGVVVFRCWGVFVSFCLFMFVYLLLFLLLLFVGVFVLIQSFCYGLSGIPISSEFNTDKKNISTVGSKRLVHRLYTSYDTENWCSA